MSSTAGSPPTTMSTLPQQSPGLDQPKGGILLNSDRRSSDPTSPRPTLIIPPSSPLLSQAIGKSPTGSQRIRFAPLPDPRPRSLSTGENIAWTASEDENGNEVRRMEVRNIPQASLSYDTDEAVTDEDDEEGERRARGRSWSKGMESSWKISKKILTVGMWDDKDDKKEGYGGGMPLKKSVSTGGLIGSSPFRWSSVDDRKRSMQGLPIPTSPSNAHRRMSSLEPGTTSAALGSSPQPVKVKLLNGRVYGARRASEIAEFQKKQREADEPAFVEWGNTKAVTPAPVAVKSKGFLGDDDDGSGMEWVKRRREERKRKQEEEAQKAREAANSDTDMPRLSHGQSSPEAEKTVTPIAQPIELPTTPVIHISEPASPGHTTVETAAVEIPESEGQKEIPGVYDEGDDEEEDDDGDFSSDDEEEEEIDRTTAAAAGIEIMSRHHH